MCKIFQRFKVLGKKGLGSGSRIRIRIRIKIKPWIRIRIKVYADPKHCFIYSCSSLIRTVGIVERHFLGVQVLRISYFIQHSNSSEFEQPKKTRRE